MKENSSLGPPPFQVREQLQRILGSPLFSSARRQSEFLQFVVDRMIEGQAGDLKESRIGVEVYGRSPSYDPKTDSIVRAEASRLRARLREYYDTHGRMDPLRIELPKGSYTPAFRVTTDEAAADSSSPPQEPAPRKAAFHWWWAAPAAILILGTGALFWWPAGGPWRARSIAVMPATYLGLDRANDSIGEMLADEFTSALVDSPEWKVVGRAPAVDQTGRDQMLTWLQQNLHADFVLTGSYRVGENSTVTLSLQLADVHDGHLLWTGAYQRRLAFLAESQKEFVHGVVADFTAKTRQASARSARIPGNARARQSYTRARELLSTYNNQDLEQSLKLFEQTVKADPAFEPAWAGLGAANVRLKDLRGQPAAKRVTDARAAALTAIALDDSDGEAHSVLGQLLLSEDWKFRTAASELARAVELDPIRILTHMYYSLALTILGDFAGAEAAVEAARARLPQIPEVLFQQGSVFFLARQPDKLENLGRQLIALEPNGAPGHWLTGLALEEKRNTVSAVAEFQRGLAQNPRDLRTLCALSHAHAAAGNSGQAFDTAERYIDLHSNQVTRFTLSYCAAMLYTGLGRKDEAFEWLEKARSGHDNSLPFVLYDWRFDPLRSDPRFAALADWLHERMRL